MDRTTTAHGQRTSTGQAGQGLLKRLVNPVAAISFWVAITLPVVYLSLLISGIDSRSGLALFIGLVGLHVLALIGGRDHQSERIDSTP